MIMLTEKDADFVAKKVRGLIESYDGEQMELVDKLKGLSESLGVEWDEDDEKSFAESKEAHNKEVAEWQRVIELMMAGSEEEK